jgi:hypothetical protein
MAASSQFVVVDAEGGVTGWHGLLLGSPTVDPNQGSADTGFSASKRRC